MDIINAKINIVTWTKKTLWSCSSFSSNLNLNCSRSNQKYPMYWICSVLQDAQSYADDNSLLFMETSAKTSMNVNEIFMAIGTLRFPIK